MIEVEIFDGSINSYVKLHTTNKSESTKNGETTTDLYNDYIKLCNNHKIPLKYETQTMFTRQFKKYYIENNIEYIQGKYNGNNTIKGIYLKTTIIKENKKSLTYQDEIKTIYDDNFDTILKNNYDDTLIIENEKTLRSIDKLVGNKDTFILMVKANCAMGKTEQLVEYIKNNDKANNKMKILFVSFRKSFTSKQMEDLDGLGFKSYLDIDTPSILCDRLICQIDSIHRTKKVNYDLLVLDEFTSIYSQLMMNSKCSNIKENFKTIQNAIKFTKKIYICDALLRNSDIEFINVCINKHSESCISNININININAKQSNGLFGNPFNKMIAKQSNELNNNTFNDCYMVHSERCNCLYNKNKKINKEIIIYQNVFKNQIEKSVNIVKTKDILLYLMLEKLANKEKIVIAAGTKIYAQLVKDIIVQYDENLRVKLYVGGDNFTTDPVLEWMEYDVIIFTSCIAAGNSFTSKHFTTVFGYFASCSVDADLAVQMLLRVRNYENLYICVENVMAPLPVKNLKETREYLVKMDYENRIPFMIYDPKDKGKNKSLWYNLPTSAASGCLNIKKAYFIIFSSIINRKNKSKINYMMMLLKHLKSMGFQLGNTIEIEHFSEEIRLSILDIKNNLKELKDYHKNLKYEQIVKADIITNEEYENLKSKKSSRGLTKIEYNECMKYKIMKNHNITESTITKAYVMKYQEKGEMLYTINKIINTSVNHEDETNDTNITNNNDTNENKTNETDMTNNKNMPNIEDIIFHLTDSDYNSIIEKDGKLQYRDISDRIKHTDNLKIIHKIVIIYNMIKLVVNDCFYNIFNDESEKKFDKNNMVYIENYILGETTYDKYDKCLTYNMIKSRFDGKAFNKIMVFNNIDNKFEFKSDMKKTEIHTIIRNWLNVYGSKLLGIKILCDDKDRNKLKIVRDYKLKTVGNSNIKRAVFKEFYDKIIFTDEYIKFCETRKNFTSIMVDIPSDNINTAFVPMTVEKNIKKKVDKMSSLNNILPTVDVKGKPINILQNEVEILPPLKKHNGIFYESEKDDIDEKIKQINKIANIKQYNNVKVEQSINRVKVKSYISDYDYNYDYEDDSDTNDYENYRNDNENYHNNHQIKTTYDLPYGCVAI